VSFPFRLTPALLAVVLFYAYVLEHLGAGPQWNMAVKRNADICKENLWRNILYIQNFFPFEQTVRCKKKRHMDFVSN
jgi:peptidoglycan/LPS O-acetylase OafA/YrhL